MDEETEAREAMDGPVLMNAEVRQRAPEFIFWTSPSLLFFLSNTQAVKFSLKLLNFESPMLHYRDINWTLNFPLE